MAQGVRCAVSPIFIALLLEVVNKAVAAPPLVMAHHIVQSTKFEVLRSQTVHAVVSGVSSINGEDNWNHQSELYEEVFHLLKL